MPSLTIKTPDGKGHVGFEVLGAKIVVRRLEVKGIVDGRWLAEKAGAGGK